MKKEIWIIAFLFAFVLKMDAQKNDSIIRVTKHYMLDSQKGKVIKFTDKKFDKIVYYLSSKGIESSIRTFYNNGGNSYFLVLEPPFIGGKKRIMIEYSDLLEVNKAIDKFFKEVDSDCASDPDYLENKYITEDGFKIGYYVEKGKAHWIVDFDTSSPTPLLEIKKPYEFAKGLKDAQNEIEKMKNGK